VTLGKRSGFLALFDAWDDDRPNGTVIGAKSLVSGNIPRQRDGLTREGDSLGADSAALSGEQRAASWRSS